ncbi:MAG: hypothetical protein ABFD64_05385 [Armatimonadota bacterium]
MGSIRMTGDLRWQIRIELSRGVDGKRRQLFETVHGCKREAERRMNELQDIHGKK